MAEKVMRRLGPSGRRLKTKGNVGFSNIPDQYAQSAKKKGFSFNILVVGETGLGKATLMDSLFETNFTPIQPRTHMLGEVECVVERYELVENGVCLRLGLVDAQGFGDRINKEKDHVNILDYINTQFDNYLREELQPNRQSSEIPDNRIHACLYFIAPTGHSIKSQDLLVLKELEARVNIIPVIAKADTISKGELYIFKAKILQEFEENDIKIYQMPMDDPDTAEINAGMSALQPFAVVGSRREILVDGRVVRARQYKWGAVEVENEKHNDFVWLREMLIRTNMFDLIEKTHTVKYEYHRKQKLHDMGYDDVDFEGKVVTLTGTAESKQSRFVEELKSVEDEMTRIFIEKVKTKELDLKLAEEEMKKKYGAKIHDLEAQLALVEKKMRTLDEDASAAVQTSDGKKPKKKLSIF
eukprot:Nk52_evm69s2192 gene=Nk52_evmTU69s2192